MKVLRNRMSARFGACLLALCGCVTDTDEPEWLMEDDEAEDAAAVGHGARSLSDASRHTRVVPGFALEIAKAGADIELSWADQGATEYEVWVSQDPYFSPEDPGSTLLASAIVTPEFIHGGGNDASERYYRVRAVGGAGALSTTAGMITYALFSGYTALGQCLVSEIDTSYELADDMESAMNGTHMWDPVTEDWTYSWGTNVWNSLSWTVGQSISVSHYDPDPPVPGTYTIVGLVPEASEVAVPMVPGMNLVTTVRSSFESLSASALLAGVPGGVRVGLWSSATQSTEWYPSSPEPGSPDPDPNPQYVGPYTDFEIPPCATVQIEVTEPSTWPADVELPQSCAEILAANPAATSGRYTIFPDGALMQAYCDMETDGGGWTLVAKVSQADLDDLPESPGWFGAPLAADTLASPDFVLNAGLATQGASRFADVVQPGSQARFSLYAADDLGQTARWYKQVASAESFAGWFHDDAEPSQVCTDVAMTMNCDDGIIAETGEPGLVELENITLESYGYANYCGALHMRLDSNFAGFVSGICSCTLDLAGNAWHDSYQQHWGNALSVWLR